MVTGKHYHGKVKGKKMANFFVFVFVSVIAYIGLFGATTTGKGKGKGTANQTVYCKTCGKTLRNPNSIANGQGHLCGANNTPHIITLTSAPTGYITVGNLARYIKAHKGNCSINKMVSALGRDRGIKPPASPITCPFYYAGNRYVHSWLGTLKGLHAMQTNNYTGAPIATIPANLMQLYQQTWQVQTTQPTTQPTTQGQA